MKEGMWYKVIDASDPPTKFGGVVCELLAGDFWRLSRDYGSTMPEFTSVDGEWWYLKKTRFDQTPHERTVFPNAPDLLERVRCIDPAAAEWLEFGDHSKVANFDAGKCNLDNMMIWSSTPQGHIYWKRLHDAVDYEDEETPVTETFLKGERVEVRDDEDGGWEPAVFLCMDEESEGGLRYVVRNMFGSPDGYEFCRRPEAPKRPHIEPGTPIEVWDREDGKHQLDFFVRWNRSNGEYIVDGECASWEHCRVLAPTGVEV